MGHSFQERFQMTRDPTITKLKKISLGISLTGLGIIGLLVVGFLLSNIAITWPLFVVVGILGFFPTLELTSRISPKIGDALFKLLEMVVFLLGFCLVFIMTTLGGGLVQMMYERKEYIGICGVVAMLLVMYGMILNGLLNSVEDSKNEI